jgi:DNA invertase Pin-like site-specific DNA recombinase
LHSCDKPGCVNPKHLRLGSQADNMADKKRRGRQAFGVRHGMAKLKVSDVVRLFDLHKRGMKPNAIAEILGVTGGRVREILRGRRGSWRNVPEVLDALKDYTEGRI